MFATIHSITLGQLLETTICLSMAFVLGALIGYERQCRQRTAGLKTNILVAIGASLFVIMGGQIYGPEGSIRVGAYVVSGIGFLGAGIIMREGGSVVGLNTAATLWCSAAIGTLVGGGLLAESVLGTLFILAANTSLHSFIDRINRRPIALSDLEGVCAVHVIASHNDGREAMALLKNELSKYDFNLRRLEVQNFGNEKLRIEAIIDTTSADIAGLDMLVETISHSPSVTQAFWSRGATG
ncbi:MAG: MgtC/SapB family protein [Thermoguttaceae bacterium]